MKDFRTITGFCSVSNNSASVNDHKVFEYPAPQFKEFSTALYKSLGTDYPKFYKMDNLSKLGFLSVELLLRENDTRSRFSGSRTGVIFMNSSTSLDSDRIHQKSIMERTNYFPSPSVFVYTLPNIVIGEICIRNKITGENTFFVQEKFNPLFLEIYINHLFDCEIINRCLAGWIELDGDNYESSVCLIEKTEEPIPGFAIFEASAINDIYSKNR